MTRPVWLQTWPVAYVHRSRSWTVRSQLGTAWGALSPEKAAIEPVEPADDKRLPGLARALRSGQLVGYRWGRRAVVRSDDGYVKVLRPSRVEALVDTHRRLHEAEIPVRFPRIVSANGDGRVELEALPAASVHDLIRSQRSHRLALPIERIAEALADLHGIHRGAGPSGPSADDRPEIWPATVARAEPDAANRLELIAAQLPPLRPVPPVLIHGDLHDKNILVSDRSVGLIDLDGVRIGSAEDDLANLGVHLQLRCLQSGRPLAVGEELAVRLYRRYRNLREISPDRLHAAERHTWFRLACLYHFRVASRPLVPSLLELADPGDRSRSTVNQR